jgi:3-carboxy-cis,cis-muconate cycloisomerase
MAFSPLDSTLLGPLFTTPEMAAVFSDRAYVLALLRVETALAKALFRLGRAPAGLAEALAALQPEAFDLNEIGRQTGRAGVPIIPFVAAVRRRLPPEFEPAFHAGATTQDISDSALVVQMRAAFALIAADAAAVIAGLAALANRHRLLPCIGRTYLQHAAPITFGFKAAIWLYGIAEVCEALPDLQRRVLVASLGGPVGTLAGLGSDGPALAAAFAEALGLGSAPIAWHTRRAAIVETGQWLNRLIGALAKFARDVVLLSASETAEVSEPLVAGRGGSSAMPHKRNPVAATLIASAGQVAPFLAGALAASQVAEHERPAGAWHAEWLILPQLFGLAAGALDEARQLAEGLQVDPQNMRRNIELTRGLIFADAALGALSPMMGRGRAHELIEAAAAKVRASKATLSEVLRSDPRIAAHGVGAALEAAFDLQPAIQSAAPWIDAALAEATRVRGLLALDANHAMRREQS